MDKISIVKRRQQYSNKQQTHTIRIEEKGTSPEEEYDPEKTLVLNRQDVCPEEKKVAELPDDSGHIVSIAMTEEQSKILQANEQINKILMGVKKDPALELKRTADGRIIFNYRFNKAVPVKMLRPDQVCEMLQISRGFLIRMVNEKKINSYKFGRLRRFLLEDILNFLLKNEEASKRNK